GISRPRGRHRPEKPGFRGARPRLWRPWRDGRDHGRLRARLRAGAEVRQAGDHRGQARPRGDHAGSDADGYSGEAVAAYRQPSAGATCLTIDSITWAL